MANIFSSDFWINNPNKRIAQRVYDSQERDVNTPNMFFQNLSKYGTPNTMLGNIASGIPQPTDNPMLSLGQNSDISSLLQSFKPSEYSGSQVARSFGLDAQKEAEARNATEVQSPIIKADTNNLNDAHNQFIQRYLEQAANNAMNFQGNQSQNAAIDYNNRIEAGIARGANSRSAGSYHPTYQKAVVYTPQALNFGSNQQQVSNPYLSMFDGKGISVTLNKDTIYPQGMEITQNGKSLFDSNRKLLPNQQLSNQTKNWFTGNTNQSKANKNPTLLPETEYLNMTGGLNNSIRDSSRYTPMIQPTSFTDEERRNARYPGIGF